MASKAPPPTRMTAARHARSTQMFALINALPPSKEKDAILLHEQYAEWEYHVNECRVKTYTQKPTQNEKLAGVVIQDGKEIKLFKAGQWCHHCKCSAQEFKRHTQTKKCIQNRRGSEHLKQIREFKFKGRSQIEVPEPPTPIVWATPVEIDEPPTPPPTPPPTKKIKKLKMKKRKKLNIIKNNEYYTLNAEYSGQRHVQVHQEGYTINTETPTFNPMGGSYTM